MPPSKFEDITEIIGVTTEDECKALVEGANRKRQSLKGTREDPEEPYWDRKIRKYANASDQTIIEKEHKQRSKKTQTHIGAVTAGFVMAGTVIGTVGLGSALAVYHGGVSIHHLHKCSKSDAKAALLRSEMESRRLKPKKRSGLNIVRDVAGGLIIGGIGFDILAGIVDDANGN